VNDFVRPESMEVPEGGLASFLTATVGEWADEDVSPKGIASLETVADKLAEYGRYEDTYMVHAAQGETVIPMAVFDENPRLKASLFSQMRAMGIDPEQYVVGNELNSINPVTGQPEFFLKKLFKGLKKAVKKVIKVVKKVAPIALSIGLSFVPGIGPILGSALGSGIGTLIQGGNLKDALKMGAIGGLTAGLFKGIGGGIKGMQTGGEGFLKGFGSGVQSGLPGAGVSAPVSESVADYTRGAGPDALAQSGTAVDPLGRISGTGAPTGFSSPVAPPDASIMDFQAATPSPVGRHTGNFAGYQYGDAAVSPSLQTAPPSPAPVSSGPQLLENPLGDVAGPSSVDTSALTTPARTVSTTLDGDMSFNINQGQGETSFQGPKIDPSPFVGPSSAASSQVPFSTALEQAQTPSTWHSVKDMFVDVGPGDKGFFGAAKDVFFPSSTTPQDIVAQQLNKPGANLQELYNAAGGEAAYNAMIDKATTKLAEQMLVNPELYKPGFMRKALPLAAAGAGIMGVSGGFEQPEMEEAPDPFNLGGQSAWDLVAANPAKYRVFGSGGPYGAAQGGSTSDFPRRDGAIAGPGTGTSDDIPAMLSDGEFVMTAQAVRGAGNGSRENGVRKMYDIMRSYEGVA
jgi:hypothetical protein